MDAMVAQATAKSTLKCTRQGQYDPALMSPADKVVICKDFLGSGLSLRAYGRLHGMGHYNLSRWMRGFRASVAQGQLTFLPTGRPLIMDEQAQKLCRAELIARRVGLNCPDKSQIKDVMVASVRAAKRLRGQNDDVVVDMCDRTFRNLSKKMKIVSRKANGKTDARIEAEGDPRNAFSMYCMSRAFCGVAGIDREVKSPHLIFNWDATQFKVSATGTLEVGVVSDGEADNAKHIPATKPTAGDLDIFVKLYHFHNAAGYPATPVFVIAEDSMDKEAFEFHKVSLAGNTGN